MGLFDRWLFGESREERGSLESVSEALLPRRFAGELEDDCPFSGSGVYYLYRHGDTTPVYVGRAANLRHALRWQRYDLSRGRADAPRVDQMRWEATATDGELEAASLEQQERERLQPHWNVAA